MKPSNRPLLQRVINEQFGRGINKVDLFNAIELFIDTYYPPPPRSHDSVNKRKSGMLQALLEDIYQAGGIKKWKSQLNE